MSTTQMLHIVRKILLLNASAKFSFGHGILSEEEAELCRSEKQFTKIRHVFSIRSSHFRYQNDFTLHNGVILQAQFLPSTLGVEYLKCSALTIIQSSVMCSNYSFLVIPCFFFFTNNLARFSVCQP